MLTIGMLAADFTGHPVESPTMKGEGHPSMLGFLKRLFSQGTCDRAPIGPAGSTRLPMSGGQGLPMAPSPGGGGPGPFMDEAVARRIDAHIRWLESGGKEGTRGDFRGASLQSAYLFMANLQRADLAGADLRGANVQWADLREANLEGARLEGADFFQSNLQSASLRNAAAQEASFFVANLTAADLGGAHLERADLRGANLRGARFEGADLSGANLEQAETEGAAGLP